MPLHAAVRAARDFLVDHRDDYAGAVAGFEWPQVEEYNFATDWFDGLAEERPDDTALWVIDAADLDDTPDGAREVAGTPGTRLSFAELAARSKAVAAYLADLGLSRGDRLLLVLGNCVELWEVMLAAMRIGAVIIPAATQLAPADLTDRVDRGKAVLVVAHAADTAKFTAIRPDCVRIAVGDPVDGWHAYAEADALLGADRTFPGTTRAGDQLLLYFTSGTTAKPKLVEHTATSYPIGHLSTMYWIGLRPGDVHLNISSPGWAKHAWSNLFAPWLAGATVLVFNYARFVPDQLLRVLAEARVTTFCAPPTVWRMLIQADLATVRPAETGLRELLSAGEPLNPEVIHHIAEAWDITLRDGYGQTETSSQVANSPGQPLKPGSMGRPLPGYRVVLMDPASGERSDTDGELCLELDPRPTPLMTGYKEDADTFDQTLCEHAFAGGVYHTGDVVSMDADGYLTYVGRADDVFKASDYRISPFELESVLIEHPAVAEAAVIPAPDRLRLAVPKAYVTLTTGFASDATTARSILGYARERLAPYKRIRRLEFAELPKTISGKIRRVELREAQNPDGSLPDGEFRDTDFDL